MKLPLPTQQRLQFLDRVVTRECQYLQDTTTRLFTPTFTPELVEKLERYPEIAERVEAFVGRFGRLQDNLGDKLLPALLSALGERVASAADNLDKAERLGWIPSADEWFAMRSLRNQMVHEYVEDPVVLMGALQAGQQFVSCLLSVAQALHDEMAGRDWL